MSPTELGGERAIARVQQTIKGYTVSAQTITDAKCQEIYREARTFFDKISSSPNYGFKILNGPPLYQPPILFVGYQPGGGSDDGELEKSRGAEDRWPAVCEYATESWILAKKMRRMFGRQYLAQCVGMNAIFLRAPHVDEYKRDFDKNLREQVEQFCLPKVAQIIEATDPAKVVAIGFDTLNLFGGGIDGLVSKGKNGRPRPLTRVGQIAGRQAIATLHLSGARISNTDLDRIRDHVLAQ